MILLNLEETKLFICKAMKYKKGILPELQFELKDGKGSIDAFIGGITKKKAEEFLNNYSVLGIVMGIGSDKERLSFLIVKDNPDKFFIDIACHSDNMDGINIYNDIMK